MSFKKCMLAVPLVVCLISEAQAQDAKQRTKALVDTRIPASAIPEYPAGRQRLADLNVVRSMHVRVDATSPEPADELRRLKGSSAVAALLNLALTEEFLELEGLEHIIGELGRRGGATAFTGLQSIYDLAPVLAERVDALADSEDPDASAGTIRRIRLAVMNSLFEGAAPEAAALFERAARDTDPVVGEEAKWLLQRLTAQR